MGRTRWGMAETQSAVSRLIGVVGFLRFNSRPIIYGTVGSLVLS